ncbi:hypothetical protein PR048_018887 [Dryococelus australis]|uniref:Uncharacterized protein n=1 Tax=Dryococelus australis TaxID=614101 RepID=A0ABQ9H1Y0_9NEOP|nr:hypothetical protein PR048_018887 [Dryococelus australis]
MAELFDRIIASQANVHVLTDVVLGWCPQYNIKKREEIQEAMPQEEPNPLMRKKKTPEELAREAEAEEEDELTSKTGSVNATQRNATQRNAFRRHDVHDNSAPTLGRLASTNPIRPCFRFAILFVLQCCGAACRCRICANDYLQPECTPEVIVPETAVCEDLQQLCEGEDDRKCMVAPQLWTDSIRLVADTCSRGQLPMSAACPTQFSATARRLSSVCLSITSVTCPPTVVMPC